MASPSANADIDTQVGMSVESSGSPLSPDVFIETSQPTMEDFIIGDRVIVGNKLGIIAFIGDVKFAAGEWAGVVLDEPAGKNDGMIQGTRYFQCDPKRGVFSRLSKLQRAPNTSPRPPSSLSENRNPSCRKQTQSPYQSKSQLVVSNNNISSRKESIGVRNSGSRTPNRERKDSGSSHSNASTTNSSFNSIPLSTYSQDPSHLRVGQRVLVNNNKTGTLRYLGSTDFAQGEWAGVELDEPLGKNDGSVNGKRYFECKQAHGLFAPVHKVTVISTGSPALRRCGTPNGHSSPHPGTPRRASQESLTSTGSSASVKNNSAFSQNGFDKKRSKTLSTVPSLQKALREKEQHIEQLLKEREMERTVFTNSTDKNIAGIQNEYSQLVTLREDKIKQFTSQIEKLEKENKLLTTELHDSKQQIEDLQFQMEEEAILNEEKADATDSSHVSKDLEEERKLRTQAEDLLKTTLTEFEKLKVEYDKSEETQLEYLDQIDEMSHKISVTERQIKSQGNNNNDALSAQIEESEKLRSENRKLKSQISELEKRLQDQTHLSNKNHELLQEQLSAAHNKISNLQTQADNTAKLQSDNEELNVRLTNTELQLTESTEKLKMTQSELDNSNNHNKKLTDQLAELEQRFAQLTNQSHTTSEQSTLQSQLDSTLRKLEDSQQNCLSLETRVQDLQSKINSSNSETENKIKEITEKYNNNIININNNHKRVIETRDTQLENLQHQLTLSSQRAQIEEETDHTQLVQLEQKLIETTTSSMRLKSEYEGRIAFLNQQIKLLETEKRQLEESLAHKSQTVAIMKTQIKETQDRLSMWQDEVKNQIENNKKNSENDLESLKKELVQSQTLLGQLEKRLAVSEDQKSRLQLRVCDLQTELQQAHNSIFGSKHSNSTYRDTQDVLFNQLKHQVEVMETNVFKAQEENLIVKEENGMLRSELESIRHQFAKFTKREECNRKTFSRDIDSARQEIETQKQLIEMYEIQLKQQPNSEGEFELINQLREMLKLSEEERRKLQAQVGDLCNKLDEFKMAADTLNNSGKFSDKDGSLNGSVNGQLGSRKISRSDTRPYCDICDIFDTHTTDNCPVQTQSGPNPYCDICSVSDHWTADCTEE